MNTTGVLPIIRRLALVGAGLSVLVVPLGLIGLASGLSPDIGDNGLGDAIALGVGIVLIVAGVVGVILGAALANFAKHASANPIGIRGTRRTIIVAGLIVAGVEILISAMIGGGWLLSASLVAAFAIGYLVVAVTIRRRGVSVLAGVVGFALLALGAVPLVGQASLIDSGGRRDARVALLPTDWQDGLSRAAAAAPDGWAVPTLTARVTDYSPSEYGAILPQALADRPLRGIIVVDCAGSEQLQVVARDPSTPGDGTIRILGTIGCRAEPQVVSIDIPAVALQMDASGTYVLGISMDPVSEGSGGGMNRAVLLVALVDAPDPDPQAIRATLVAAFGSEAPH